MKPINTIVYDNGLVEEWYFEKPKPTPPTPTERLLEGLRIIEKHRPPTESENHIIFSKDWIFVGDIAWPMEDEYKIRLADLGWLADTDAMGTGQWILTL